MAGSSREWDDGSAVRLDRRDPYLRLQSVTILVRNLDRSLEFYTKQLGFQLVFDARSKEFVGRRFVTVSPPDGTANLTLVAPERDSEQYKLIGRHSQVTFVTEDVLAKFREWSTPRALSGQSPPEAAEVPRARANRKHSILIPAGRGATADLGRRVRPFQGSRRQFVLAGQL